MIIFFDLQLLVNSFSMLYIVLELYSFTPNWFLVDVPTYTLDHLLVYYLPLVEF